MNVAYHLQILKVVDEKAAKYRSSSGSAKNGSPPRRPVRERW